MVFTDAQKKLIDAEIARNNFAWPCGVGVIVACERKEDGGVDFSSAIEITEDEFLERINQYKAG